VRVGINGFGRIGRLALRAAWRRPDVSIVHTNEIGGDAATAAHLLVFDSVHGHWGHDTRGEGVTLTIDDKALGYSRHTEPGTVPWRAAGVDIVLEATGKFRTPEALEAYFKAGVKKVIVAAPVKQGALNIVMKVNDDWHDPAETFRAWAGGHSTGSPGRQRATSYGTGHVKQPKDLRLRDCITDVQAIAAIVNQPGLTQNHQLLRNIAILSEVSSHL
jgi:hypothetical protein